MTLRSLPLPAATLCFPLAQASRFAGELLAADALHILERNQSAVVVVLQSARLVVDDLAQMRQPIRHRDELVDLLLILDHGERHFGMRQDVSHLVGHRVGIDRHRHGAERLPGAHRPIKPRAIAADDGELVAAFEAELGKADREGADLLEHLRPGPALPDAEILVAHRRARATGRGIVDQKLRQRI